MPWLALKLFAGGALKNVWTFLCHRSVWQLAFGAALLLSAIEHFQLVTARHDAARWQKQFTAEHDGRIADRKAYTKAQSDAHAQNVADVQRVEAKQKEITNETVSTLNARLERIRGELRATPSAPSGLTDKPQVSEDGTTPCRAFDPSWLCVSPADRLRAAENEERHDQLIDWVERQSAIDPNKPVQ